MMKPIEQVYEEDAYEYSDYQPLLESFEYEIVIQVDEAGYQGDSFVLFRNGVQYGILTFGWGSCSGCDALQGCSSLADVGNLRDSIHSGIQWGNPQETLHYLKTHDWEGDWSWGSGEARDFIKRAIEHLTPIATPVTPADNSELARLRAEVERLTTENAALRQTIDDIRGELHVAGYTTQLNEISVHETVRKALMDYASDHANLGADLDRTKADRDRWRTLATDAAAALAQHENYTSGIFALCNNRLTSGEHEKVLKTVETIEVMLVNARAAIEAALAEEAGTTA